MRLSSVIVGVVMAVVVVADITLLCRDAKGSLEEKYV